MNACEFEEIAERIAAEKARPVRDGRVVVRPQACPVELLPGRLEVGHVQAEMTGCLRIDLTREEMQLEARPYRKPDQIEMGERRGRWDLFKPEHVAVERPDGALLARREG